MNTFVQHYTKNTLGRDFAVGDIHGMFSLLQTELDGMGFDPSVDRLFSVGDLVDRGPDSELCLEWIAKPWFHAVQGNHEDMAIRWPNGHMDGGNYAANGGGWNVANTPDSQRQYADALGALPIAIEVETAEGMVGIVHADCPFPNWPDFIWALSNESITKNMRDRVIDAAMWSRERIQSEDQSGVEDVRAVIVGHTPLKRPSVLGNVYHIDTGAVFREGYFTFIDLATLETIPAMPKKLDWEAV
ncbi:metallophosphoesterase [Paraburkholderia bryophila]|uniref:metallophosphoesterase n=1 Tax=Paraburkholderia bryophila TaxID=420952 RepID=UPI00234AC88F|nr:metallophosphoesterase [Paraburkholderia bryophila]WCM21390.1 metallophosphoesterase [Paraburkholderia bryophila]